MQSDGLFLRLDCIRMRWRGGTRTGRRRDYCRCFDSVGDLIGRMHRIHYLLRLRLVVVVVVVVAAAAVAAVAEQVKLSGRNLFCRLEFVTVIHLVIYFSSQ